MILVWSRANIIRYRKEILQDLNDNKISLISIHDFDLPLIIQHQNVLNLWFDDIEPTYKKNGYILEDQIEFSLHHADAIVKFCEDAYSNGIRNFIVNCTAGICRSGAVGEWIAWRFGYDLNQFMKNNSGILPNRWVQTMLYHIGNRKD